MTKIALLIAAGAVVLSLLAIILNLVLFGKIKSYLSDRKTDKGLDCNGNIREEIISVVLGSARIKEGLPKPQIIRETEQASKEISTETFNFIVETVVDELERRRTQKKEAPALHTEEVRCKYAEPVDSKTGTFYHIDNSPGDTTIYKLDLDEVSGDGTFTLYKGAYKKVLECRDFLEGACEMSGDGVSIEIASTGKLLFANGKWTIVKPMEVKFV